jgi:hypothetical protein
LLNRSGRVAADRWLRGGTEPTPPAIAVERGEFQRAVAPVFAETV